MADDLGGIGAGDCAPCNWLDSNNIDTNMHICFIFELEKAYLFNCNYFSLERVSLRIHTLFVQL